jgi:hypothetical protein
MIVRHVRAAAAAAAVGPLSPRNRPETQHSLLLFSFAGERKNFVSPRRHPSLLQDARRLFCPSSLGKAFSESGGSGFCLPPSFNLQ